VGGISNLGQLFAEMTGPSLSGIDFKFGGKDSLNVPKLDVGRVGGLALPNFNISGLSRALGPVGDLPNIALGRFDVGKLFGSRGARSLGGLRPPDITDQLKVPATSPIGPPAPAHLKVTNELIFADGRAHPPTADRATLEWTPPLGADPLHIFNPNTANPA